MSVHGNSIVIDGLVVSKWSRNLFDAMHRGGLTAANCTCGLWEGFVPSMQAIAEWKRRFSEYGDILKQIYSVSDIEEAKSQGKLGIILGWQNSTGIDEDLRLLPLFRELGIRVIQLTYHTANMAGSGCLESHDGGMTDFGRDLVAALNEERILIDLSHVGAVTSRDAITASKVPVAYTHCAPRALKDHPRNKTDSELRFIAEHGGMVGVTMFPPFMRRGNDSSLDDYLDAIEHTLNVCGEDHVGIGTDFTQDIDDAGMQYFVHDKGYGRCLLDIKEVVNPTEFATLEHYPNLTAGMERRNWPVTRIEKVIGANWMRTFDKAWT